ncbi:hypothetical protein COY27_05005 [Candidatus Woesearchaeota archaeon CG_4_10_14_0_2_um_filter_33_13]|nr:MAG: hypothetical protein COY27_05005 [Candidatus Woesearchaeota archaeon CG_4_10_14_0_2_um_filter_33_13]
MIITLCSSAKFFEKLWEIKKSLEERGHEVLLPSMKDFHHLEESSLAKIQHDLINEHFQKIEQSQAVYIANFDKNGIAGYIGGNSLLEMGLAFYKKIPIFLLNNIPQQLNYKEEIIALNPIVIGKDWDKLGQVLKK